MKLSSLRPSYFARRLLQLQFARRNPDAPWLCRAAVLLLEGYLRPTDLGLEWGSGRSTVWFANRVSKLVSIEHNNSWYESVQAMIVAQHLEARVALHHIPCDLREVDEPERHVYADMVSEWPDGTLDFGLVDGMIRLTCARALMPKLKPGGLLVLDNANRYVPNRLAGGDYTTIHEPRDEPRTPAWARLLDELRCWRHLHTSDGIWDTRFWIKPQ